MEIPKKEQTPITVKPKDDPGDDIGRRYRYQWTYSAIACCMLLDETQEIEELYCEQHEDILIKHSNGKHIGVQVKTRASDQALWKSTDKTVIDSLIKFVKLDKQFHNQFISFRFLTNHPMQSSDNGKDIRFILKAISECSDFDNLNKPIQRYLEDIAKSANVTKIDAFNTLYKTQAYDNLPKFQDIEMRLISTITESWVKASGYTLNVIKQTAMNLVHVCEIASSLAHEEFLPSYLCLMKEPGNTAIMARIEGKKIDRNKLLVILEQGIRIISRLDCEASSLTPPGSGNTDLLLKKLDAGGFSVVSLNSAKDLRDKADYLGLSWINKYGHEEGLQRYSHIRSIVLSDAATAFEKNNNQERNFGKEMLADLRDKFLLRRNNKDELFDCSNEHLEGFSYVLTSECQIQWSFDRPWEGK